MLLRLSLALALLLTACSKSSRHSEPDPPGPTPTPTPTATPNLPVVTPTAKVTPTPTPEETATPVPQPEKLALVTFSIEEQAVGEKIAWQASGAKTCALTDERNALSWKDLATSGSLNVKEAATPLAVTIVCVNAKDEKVSGFIDVEQQLTADNRLAIDAFEGPKAPVVQLMGAATAPALLKWKIRNAKACRLQDAAVAQVLAEASGEKIYDVIPGSVELACQGARFQAAAKSLTVKARKELRILDFKGTDDFYGSSQFSGAYVHVKAYGAKSCEVQADNARSDKDHAVFSDGLDLEKGYSLAVAINRDTQSLLLSCSNDEQEILKQTLDITVKPRVNILNMTVTPNLVKIPWTDTSTRPVTVEWTTENHSSCQVKVKRDDDFVTLKQIPAEDTTGSLVVNVKDSTEISLDCQGIDRMVARSIRRITVEREPVFSATVSDVELGLRADGYEKCEVTQAAISYRRILTAKANRSIHDKVSLPFATDIPEYTVTCSGAQVATRVETLRPTAAAHYLVLRSGVLKDDSVQFEAAWDLGVNKDCALVQKNGESVSVVLDKLPRRGLKSLTMPLALDSTIEMAVQCASASERLVDIDRLVHPMKVCESPEWEEARALLIAPLGLSVDEVMALSCDDLFAKFQTVSTWNLDEDVTPLEPWLHFLVGVKSTQTRTWTFQPGPRLAYFGNLEQLLVQNRDIDYADLSMLASLKKVKNLTLRLPAARHDLRILQELPALQTLTLASTNTAAGALPYLNAVLGALKLEELNLKGLGFTDFNLSGLQNMPLKRLSVQDVSCYDADEAGSLKIRGHTCLNFPVNQRLGLTRAEADLDTIGLLEKLYNPGILQELTYHQNRATTIGGPQWFHYYALQTLTLNGIDSLSVAGRISTLKKLTLGSLGSDAANLSVSGIASKYPKLEDLTLNNVKLVTLSPLWELPIKRLSLFSTTLDNWDIPEERVPVVLDFMEWDKSTPVPFEQFRIQTLVKH